ncbi:relaxase domain-containing protein [Saccharopolyspora indica]|uniref:MobF family relaxase n=1 Tax=Saccharopolyspora indica TaxID=1229659 RepID=UPI0022EB0CAC|nr:MobF family relaxase [Saccharopolyspora indica]MDA3644388.1 relaxase domain-containing protein [Saccharopolyspora indica]
MIGVRKISPGGYQYLTGQVACGDHQLEPGESLSDYYIKHGYPPGQWFGRGAQSLGVDGEVTAAQMDALFGEGRHPDADRIQAEQIAAGATVEEALKATKLGYRFRQHAGADELRSKVIDAYKAHNLDNGRPVGAPIDEDTRAGIRRTVQEQAYIDAHGGERPSQAQLNRWLAEQKREMKSATAGFELVFAPPKSVSVAWALSDEDTRELIAGLQRQAVNDTLGYFQDNVAFTRKGNGGSGGQYDVQGITAAVFEHWDSRAGDPHLHTHAVVSTKVQGPDGKWTSLDGRTVLAAAVTTSEYYNNRLRDLFREHGARWSQRAKDGVDAKRPVWELDGVAPELLTGFSQRASAVEQARAAGIVDFRRQHGREPSPKEVLEIGRRAQYGTREAKPGPLPLTEHLRRWREHAAQLVNPATLGTVLGRRLFAGPAEPVAEVDVAALAEDTLATVSDYYSHFNKWNLLAEAHRQSAHLRVASGTREQLVERIVEEVLATGETVALHSPSLVEEPAELKRRSGESVFVEHNAQRFTTERTLREEAALAEWGRLRGGVRTTFHAVEHALAKAGTTLNRGQKEAVRGFATSGHRVQLLYAPAGTGKTTTMKVFAEAWRAEGGRVFAFGPSARAAQELGQSINARPHTLHQVTTALKMGVAERSFDFRRGDVLIVDEVSMAGTHTLHDVVRYALERGADVRWVGDDRQLASVEAGGAVRWFAQHHGALRLREVVRFADKAQAEASLLLHAADPAGLDYYFDRGWVQEGSRETMRDAAHRAWRTDLDEGRQTLLIVPSNEDVVALNLQARELRLRRGDVDPDSSVQLHDGTRASAGDWVVTRHNDRLKPLFGGADFVKNGDTWEVQKVRRGGSVKVRHRASGGTVVLPADYVTTHLELAYASTINRSQGMSVDGSAHGLVPQGLSREQLYTLMTRARFDNRVYAESIKHVIDSHQETPPEQDARGMLKAALERTSAETSASEELRASLNEEESLRTLIGHHDHVARLPLDDRIEAVLGEDVPHLLELPAAGALRQTLRTAEDLGWQTEHLVPVALGQGRLDGTDDQAAVLQWRIEQQLLHRGPPDRLADPTSGQIDRWRQLVHHHAPEVEVEQPRWDVLWRRAAAAAAEGLDAETAIAESARLLAERPGNDPMPAPEFTATVLGGVLADQRAHGAGWNPALPWQAHPDHTGLSDDLRDYLDRLNTAISSRHHALRAQASTDPPAWTAALGPRPAADPELAERWDRLVGLGAAYRDTYAITGDDPTRPLGDKPDSQGLRGRAWHDLIGQWAPPEHRPDPATSTGGGENEDEDVLERLRAEFDPDELLEAFAEHTAAEQTEPLSAVTSQHRDTTTELLNQHLRQVLADHAPATLEQPATDALLATLLHAELTGWQTDRLVRHTAAQRRLDTTDDPAAVLRWRIQQHLAQNRPPARMSEPDDAQVRRWQTLTSDHAPGADVTDPAWNLVWRHAAAGAAEGLDAEAAVTAAAHALTNHTPDPGDQREEHRVASQVLVDHLSEQREHGAGEQPVLPWLPMPHRTIQDTDSDLTDELHRLNDTARDRLDDLRTQVAAHPPQWAAALGPRPTEPDAADGWDHLVGLAAAYRETYRITGVVPEAPLGVDPGGHGVQATAWRQITDHWRKTMSHPNPNFHRDDALERLEALRDDVLDTREDARDDAVERRADDLDDEHTRREDEGYYERYGYTDDEELDYGSGFHSGNGF